jgi:Inward rectifier potassium channel C-terminal domain
MIRIANARHNTISKATARLWLIRAESTAEGHQLRRYYELKLHRDEHPTFELSWTLFHTIDKTSALYGLTADDLAKSDATLALNVSGGDDSAAQQLCARPSIRKATYAGANAAAISPAFPRTGGSCSTTASFTMSRRRRRDRFPARNAAATAASIGANGPAGSTWRPGREWPSGRYRLHSTRRESARRRADR